MCLFRLSYLVLYILLPVTVPFYVFIIFICFVLIIFIYARVSGKTALAVQGLTLRVCYAVLDGVRHTERPWPPPQLTVAAWL